MPGSSSPCQAHVPAGNGWTLIELLLAVVIALLVMSLLFATYHTVLTATRGQGIRRDRAEAGRAIHQLGRELQAAFLPEKDTNCVLRLDQGNGIRIEWCATLLGAQENDMRWFDITRIRYTTVTNGSDVTLVRAASPLVGPDALLRPVTNELLRGIRDIRIELFDGERWQTAWPVTDSPTLPEAARIELHGGRRENPIDITTEIFIPSGSRVAPLPR